jgi:hypothetical protein
MKKALKYNGIKISVWTDAKKFFNMKGKPFGDMPKDTDYDSMVIEGGFSSGFCTLKDKHIRFLVQANCPFDDLLSIVSYEMGHLIEGGYSKNPPEKSRYFNKHELKAEHYEKFVMDCYKLTLKIYTALK